MRRARADFTAMQIVPRSYLEPLDRAAIFGRSAPLEVDLGCGDGAFLVALAAENAARDFIGVERMIGRVRTASRKIGIGRLTNARVVQHDILHAVQQLFEPGSVDVFYLMFSDPWPKRRHHGRRVVTASFLRAVARALQTNGELRIATDDRDYFASICEIAREAALFDVSPNDVGSFPTTTFEKRFRARGLEIHRLVLRKVSLGK